MTDESRPSAVFCANDETAFGVMLGLQRLGWRVPEDISVCGFGGLPMAQMGLTSVEIPLRHLGRTGALKLFTLLNQEEVPMLEVLPTTIVERGSTTSLRS